MTLEYAAAVAIGTPTGVLELFSSDVSALDPFLADGLAVSWKRDGDGQPEPVEARFTIVAPDVLPVDIGARTSVLVYDELGGDLVATFYGRVAEVQSGPVEYGNPGGSGTLLGLAHDVVCVDYTADLAEETVNFPAYPSHEAGTRVAAYIADSGHGSYFGNGPGLDDWFDLKAEDAASGGVVERIAAVLDQVGTGELGATPDALTRRTHRRMILAPRVDPDVAPGDFHSAGGWALDAPPATYTSADPTDFPAVLEEGPDGWGLAIDDASPVVLSALYLDFSAKWRRDKFTHPTRATVTYTPTGATEPVALVVAADDAATTDPVVDLPLDATLLGDEYAAGRMALMYLPESDARDRWQADVFRYYPPDWSRLLAQPWFPLHGEVDDTPATAPGDPDTRAQCYAAPLVVAGIAPAFHPLGRTWYAGTLSAVTLTLADAKATVDVTLRRKIPPPGGAGALTINDVSGSITIADLDPAFTFYDYRLARGA